ncbi:MAG: glycoside hydrolase [Bacteroidales bacterium]|jgi:hypothetical protein|nr:glycoside hydrolase [Bacteroidales bacterium]
MEQNLIRKLLVISIFIIWGGISNDVITQEISDVKKVKDIIIYADSMFYSAFPSVIKRPDGELFVAFRRAPDRKVFGERYTNHLDPNSYLVMVRSDDGENWTKEPELIYAHPFGGSQDPCLLQMRDGSILCTSYAWAFLNPDRVSDTGKSYISLANATFLGGYVIRTEDGKKWDGPFYPLHIDTKNYTPMGVHLPAYNRGALYEAEDGRILWAVAAAAEKTTKVHLITSEDKGITWKYESLIAEDDKVAFNETSIYETPKGDIVAFLRTENYDGYATIARSVDGGKTFGKWESMNFKGHPINALRLPDNRVLLTYGYRHPPYGIRARILNPECTDYKTAQEIILREDGANGDLGYTWPVLLNDGKVLIVYYFNKNNGIRHIAGTIIALEGHK